MLSDGDLQQMFRSIDVDGSGEVDATEFANWLLHDKPDDIQWRPMKRKFEDSCGAAVQKVGWSKLFARYDTDGSGELDFGEFAKAVRADCGINEAVVSDEDLKTMFDAVDGDGSGEMDVDEFREFMESNALAQDMAFEIFYEAMFQLAELWVVTEDAAQYTSFFEQLRGRIADYVVDTDGEKKQLLRGIRTQVDEKGHEVYIITDVKLIKPFVNDGVRALYAYRIHLVDVLAGRRNSSPRYCGCRERRRWRGWTSKIRWRLHQKRTRRNQSPSRCHHRRNRK